MGAGPKFAPPTSTAPAAAAPNAAPAVTPTVPPKPAASADGSVSVAKSSGDDAAYEAFEQGRYLTALQAKPVAADLVFWGEYEPPTS